LDVDLDLVEVSFDLTFLALFDLVRVPTFFLADLLLRVGSLFLDPLGVVLCESIAKDVEEREGLMVLAVP